VGDPDAFEDLVARLDGDWVAESSELSDGRGIRVGFLSRLALGDVEQVREFPDGLAPVQIDDEGTTMAEMGRGRCGFASSPTSATSTWSAAT
jgi:hypothetical protein